MLLGLYAAPLKHTELKDGVAVGASNWIEKVATIKGKETVGPLVCRILKCLHDTGMNNIRKPLLDGVELLSQSEYLNLCHKVGVNLAWLALS